MYVLAAYDISDDRAREAAARRLLMLGFTRIQKSVYLAKGGSTLAKEAYRAVKPLLAPGDRLLVVTLPDWSIEKALTWGGVEWRRHQQALIV